MGTSRTEIFTEEQNLIATYAKALGHPARVAILEHLFRINTCICGDLVQEIGLAQATISQHLKELKELGLIKGTIDGVKVCYCIDEQAWGSMRSFLNDFLNKSPQKNECCP